MPLLRRSTRPSLLAVLLGVLLFAAACSGDDSRDAFAAAVEAASQQANDANTAANDVGADAGATDDAAPNSGFEADEEWYQTLIQRSDRFAETPVGDGGRLVIGVDCLDDVSTPTAIVTILGTGLPVGEHEGAVTPTGRPVLRSLAEQVQDQPAGSTFNARQTRYEAEEYVYTFASLGGATLTLPGC